MGGSLAMTRWGVQIGGVVGSIKKTLTLIFSLRVAEIDRTERAHAEFADHLSRNFNGALDVTRLVQRRNHQHANIMRGRIGAQPLAHLEAADLRHHDV